MRGKEHGGIFFRLLFLLCFAGLAFVLYAARHPLMKTAGELWVLDDPAAASDALIVLGDDNYAGDRAFRSAELYRAGVAPVVVSSGRMLRKNVSLAEIMAHDLESFGVPGGAIVKLDHRAQNTREEANEVSRLVSSRGWKRVFLVTSNYHARRARFIFERVLPVGITVRVSGARDSEFDPSRWWVTRQGQKLFLTELAGYVVAWWELRRAPASGAGAALISTENHSTLIGVQIYDSSHAERGDQVDIGGKGSSMATMNVVPLIDILLVLIIIFMVITPLTPKGLDALVPQPAKMPPESRPLVKTIVVQVLDAGKLKINGEEASWDSLGVRLSEVFKERAEKTAFVQGEDAVRFSDVARAIDIMRSSGVEKVGLMTARLEVKD